MEPRSLPLAVLTQRWRRMELASVIERTGAPRPPYSISIQVENLSPSLFIINQKRRLKSDLIARVGNVNVRLRHIGIPVLPLVENRPTDIALIDRDAHDVIAFGHACDVYPLADELFVVPVSPSGSDPLILAVIAVALIAGVLE